MATCPEVGVFLLIDKIFALVIAPVFVGLVLELISRMLDEKDNDRK